MYDGNLTFAPHLPSNRFLACMIWSDVLGVLNSLCTLAIYCTIIPGEQTYDLKKTETPLVYILS